MYVSVNKLGSGTGRDPGGIFRDPDPEIPDFWTIRDFSGIGIFRDKSRKIPPVLFSKFPGFSGIFRDFPGLIFGIMETKSC
jgi:hypothetical protein